MSRLRPLLRDFAGGALSATGLLRPDRFARDRLTIVTFHRVLTAEQRARYVLPGLAVTPEELAWYLDWFTDHFSCCTLDEAARRWQLGEDEGRPLLAVTFDDGQLDNFAAGRPVLAAAGVRATFFLPVAPMGTDEALWHDRLGWAAQAALSRADADLVALSAWMAERTGSAVSDPAADPLAAARSLIVRAKAADPSERDRWLAHLEAGAGGTGRPDWDRLMTWDEVAALVDDGHEIGSHSLSHALLPQCSDEELEREVGESRRLLEARLGRPVHSFCYPNGDHDARTLEAVARAGYEFAVTTRWGLNARGAPLLALSRCDMNTRHVVGADGRRSRTRLAWRVSGLYPGLG